MSLAKLIRKFFFSILLIPIILLGIFAFYFQHYITETPLKNIQKPGYVLLVKPGMTVQKIADQLANAEILDFPKLFVWWVYISDVRSQLKAGEYLVKEGSTPQDLIDLLVSGKVIQHPLTIVEGWNFETLMQAVNEAPELKHTLSGLSPKEIMGKLGHPDKHPEGHFFPDTYYFPLGTTDLAFLQRAYNTMQDKLKNAWEKRGQALAVDSPYKALILASIIEKESCNLGEYGEIAGVFHRRLQRGMPLQADPTVIYAAGKTYAGTITSELLKLQNPYNTYVNTGLPPTPIAMPSEKAIIAATQPKKGDTIYFVARGNCKGHVFSKTLEEHQVAVNRYRRIMQGATVAANRESAAQSSAEAAASNGHAPVYSSIQNQKITESHEMQDMIWPVISFQSQLQPLTLQCLQPFMQIKLASTGQLHFSVPEEAQTINWTKAFDNIELQLEASQFTQQLESWLFSPLLTPVEELEKKLYPTFSISH